MKSIWMILTVFAIAWAQPEMKPGSQYELIKLTDKLQLTDSQKNEIMLILEEASAQIEKDRKENQGDREAQMAAIHERKEIKNDRIRLFLNDEQKSKFDTLIEKESKLNQRTVYLAERLNLSDEQIEKIDLIEKENQKHMEAMRGKFEPGEGGQGMSEMRNLREQNDVKIEALLTPEQKKIYQEIKNERSEQMRGMMKERKGKRKW